MSFKNTKAATILATIGIHLLSACQTPSPGRASTREPDSLSINEAGGWQYLTTSDPSTFAQTLEDSRRSVEVNAYRNRIMEGCKASWFAQKGRRLDRDLLWIRARALPPHEFHQLYGGRLADGARECIVGAQTGV